MTVANLVDVLGPAHANGYGVVGFVALGWEDAEAYVEAAEEVQAPIILQAGPGFRKHMPVEVTGPMFRHLAEQASIPVVCHIDHGKTIDECVAGIDNGFSSVMFDGSRLSLDENVEKSAAVVEIARKHGVSVEGEIGFVGFDSGEESEMTKPEDAKRLAVEANLDALAVSVGNVHLQRTQKANINTDRLAAIEAVVPCPLVMHGASGVPADMRRHLAGNTAMSKFNIGTEFRQCFGASLRKTLADDTDMFDRMAILSATKPALKTLAKKAILNLRPDIA